MNNYKKIFLVFILTLQVFTIVAQQKSISIDNYRTTCNYNLTDGKLNGIYTSFYFNGNKKSEGKLINGYRTGTWIVWDSTGRKRMERVYKNPFEFTRVFPPVPNEGAIPLLIENRYKLQYDSGIVKYATLKAEDAIWRHKIWRYLTPANNDVLFSNNRLLNIVKNLSLSGKIDLYDAIDDRFTTVLKKEDAKNIFNNSKMEVIGFKLKEENIFDMERLVSEYRILGFCPVVKIDDKILDLFWVYYPEARKYFGKEIIAGKTNALNVKTLDDLFVFRDFASTIIKTTIDNPYDVFIKKYPGITPEGIIAMQEELELTIIEAENDIWGHLTK